MRFTLVPLIIIREMEMESAYLVLYDDMGIFRENRRLEILGVSLVTGDGLPLLRFMKFLALW